MIAALGLMPCSVIASDDSIRSLLESRHERVVIQHWDISCGAAALATILRYEYDQAISEREIALEIMQRQEYLANPALVRAREGFSLLDLQRVAERHHYKGVGLGHLSLNDLVARAPIIVSVKFRGFNHFVVFRGIYRGQVVLADPAWGNRTMATGAFERAWLKYPKIGRTGFRVLPGDGSEPRNRLAPTAKDILLAYVGPDDDDATNQAGENSQDTGPVLLAGPALDLPASGVNPPDQPRLPLPPEVTRPPPENVAVAANSGSLPGSSPPLASDPEGAQSPSRAGGTVATTPQQGAGAATQTLDNVSQATGGATQAMASTVQQAVGAITPAAGAVTQAAGAALQTVDNVTPAAGEAAKAVASTVQQAVGAITPAAGAVTQT